MLCYGGGDVLCPSAYTDEHGGMKGKELTENQRRNKKEYIIRKKEYRNSAVLSNI